MVERQVTLPLPENLYRRLQQAAQATQQSLTDVLLHAIEIGSPPSWELAPSEFQADLAPLDRLYDEALWRVARSRNTQTDMGRFQELLDKSTAGTLTENERLELTSIQFEADRFMLRKAHAAALLRWRGHKLPPAGRM